MTYGPGTMSSFPDLVQRGHLCVVLQKWAQAEDAYLLAADLACREDAIAELLVCAWICHERGEGRISRLESGR